MPNQLNRTALAAARTFKAPPGSLLMGSAWARIGGALLLVFLLWLGVAWALTETP